MGTFIIVSGPSTVGKTTIVEELLKRVPGATRITTITTRAPREGERDGEDFFFVSREEFKDLRDTGKLVEWSEHFDNYYGTSHDYLRELLAGHPIVFGVLDINGMRQAKEREPSTRTIFIKPGDPDDLKRRLVERTDLHSEKEREERLARSVLELESTSKYDYIVTNIDGKLEATIDQVHCLCTKYV